MMPRSFHSFSTLLASACLCVVLFTSRVSTGERLRTVALTGTHVPGLGPDALFDTFKNAAGILVDVSHDPAHPDLRTISDLYFFGHSGNDDGRRSWFNDNGQLTFWASFTDGSEGMFVSNLVAVPEPSSSVLLIAWMVAAITRRAHR
jgi:hypothetical protein